MSFRNQIFHTEKDARTFIFRSFPQCTEERKLLQVSAFSNPYYKHSPSVFLTKGAYDLPWFVFWAPQFMLKHSGYVQELFDDPREAEARYFELLINQDVGDVTLYDLPEYAERSTMFSIVCDDDVGRSTDFTAAELLTYLRNYPKIHGDWREDASICMTIGYTTKTIGTIEPRYNLVTLGRPFTQRQVEEFVGACWVPEFVFKYPPRSFTE